MGRPLVCESSIAPDERGKSLVWLQLNGEVGGVTHFDGDEENRHRALRSQVPFASLPEVHTKDEKRGYGWSSRIKVSGCKHR